MTLSTEEYNVLCKIARNTKMDCWFMIEQGKNGHDFVRDIEEGKRLTLQEGVRELQEGMTTYADCDLSEQEVKVFETLLIKLAIPQCVPNFSVRPMLEEEDKYTFRNSTQISMQTGFIGYLRADMGSSGEEFFSSWFPFNDNLKTGEFVDEFDGVINSLREEGDILHSLSDLRQYCRENPQSKMSYEMEYFGVRIDTKQYTYLMRLCLLSGKYNLCCYCFVKEFLDAHIRKARNGIWFANPGEKDAFRVPDGGEILLVGRNGFRDVRTCRYINETHMEINSNLYHIHQFEEMMEKKGMRVEIVKD